MLPTTSPEATKMLNGNPSLRYRRRLKNGILFMLLIILLGFVALGNQIHPQIRKNWGKSWSFSMPGSAFLPLYRNKVWDARAESVRITFRKAYGEYQKYAFPNDELRPLSNGSKNSFNGWAVTAVDSIDTMILMNLTEEYEQVRRHVGKVDFSKGYTPTVPFFETIIRYVGGLLSAYHLSEDRVFLTAADDIARKLAPGFETPSGIPAHGVNFMLNHPEESFSLGENVYLAEIASCQMEYKYLAYLTRRVSYFKKADNVTRILQRHQKPIGLWPTIWDSKSGDPVNHQYAIGGLADSAYEYLLKGYLMSGRTETYLLEMHMEAMRAALERLVYVSPTRNMMYITDLVEGRPIGNMQHLSCFFPGLLALGNYLLPNSVYKSLQEKVVFELAAEGLATTCYLLYADSMTGLGAEEVQFLPYEPGNFGPGKWINRIGKWIADGMDQTHIPGVTPSPEPLPGRNATYKDYSLNNGAWYLRPEAVETMYLMWRTTGQTIWRERAWEMYESMIMYTQLPSGAFSSIINVDVVDGLRTDEQQSYFFAETLKYLYLIFLEEDPWPLDKFVFNTEAHPFPVFTLTDADKSWFGIP